MQSTFWMTAQETEDELKRRSIEYLKQRYAEQCDKFPTLRNDVTEQGYVSVNLPYAMRNIRRKVTAKDWSTATRKQCATWLKSAGLPVKYDTTPWNQLPEDMREKL